MLTTTIWFHICMAAGILIGLAVQYFRPSRWSLRIAEIGFLMLLGVCSFLLGENRFGDIRLLAYGFFIHLPVFIALSSLVSRYRGMRVSRWIFVFVGVIAITGIDAFYIEPQWLAVRHVGIKTPKLTKPMTLAVLADIQTDTVGTYESEALRRTCLEQPDLILFAGDYIQTQQSDSYRKETRALNDILRRLPCNPQYGIVAIEGNIDLPGWTKIFDDLPTSVSRTDEAKTYRFGEIVLTTLSWDSSMNTGLSLPDQQGFHIVLGHAPDYSLGHNTADLLLAGHTHGGQIQIPFLGPLISLSGVPRRWASGVTELGGGRRLIVSNGVGLERGFAPRMRFWCRPEVIVIHLGPKAP